MNRCLAMPGVLDISAAAGAGRRKRLHSVAFAGGGSGGHLMPGLALGEAVLSHEPDCQCLFLTSRRTIDQAIMTGFLGTPLACRPESRIHWVPLTATAGRRILARPWHGVPEMLRGIQQVRRLLIQHQVRLVVGLGGFASVAPVIAAWRCNIPVVLLEQNVVPGVATRFLARLAAVTCSGLPMEERFLSRWPGEVRLTGIPLRSDFLSGRPERPTTPETSALRLLVLGGSQGASSINRLMQVVLSENGGLLPLPPSCQIVHQSGPHDREMLEVFYSKSPWKVRVVELLAEMSTELQQADLVVSRAGAVTLAELASTATPAILIPLHRVAGGHQLQNARYFANHEAVRMVDETAETAARDLSQALRECTADDALRARMSDAMQQLSRRNATQDVLDVMCQTVR